MPLCTVLFGVLKSGSITFIGELPEQKVDKIKRLGFGLLNKITFLFPYVFWDSNVDIFGHVADYFMDEHFDKRKWDFRIRQAQERSFLSIKSIDTYFHNKNIQTWRKCDYFCAISLN
uniref:Amine oxidase domain-containing protein n=1 Tax=Solanum lycopersicum TaxID=4081 RepID=A0A3Q7IUQ3_SOLLC